MLISTEAKVGAMEKNIIPKTGTMLTITSQLNLKCIKLSTPWPDDRQSLVGHALHKLISVFANLL